VSDSSAANGIRLATRTKVDRASPLDCRARTDTIPVAFLCHRPDGGASDVAPSLLKRAAGVPWPPAARLGGEA
jgi:hypothetical protein